MKLFRVISFVLPVCGCGEVLRLEDYAVAEPDASAPAGSAALPLLPAQPDDVGARRETCARCVEEKCDAEYQVCLGSERCRDMIACMGPSEESSGCSDPNCLARCLTEHLHSPYYHAYFTCAFGGGVFPTPTQPKCTEECGAGINWGCIGNFSYAPPPPTPATVQVFSVVGSLQDPAAPFPGFALLEASACIDGYPTDEPTLLTGCGAWQSVDPFIGAQLQVGENTAVAFRSTVPDLGLGAPHRTYPWPAARSGPMWISLVGGSSATAVADSLGHDSERGALAVVQNDCLGTMGSTDIQIPGAVPWTAEGRPVDAAWETHLTGLGTQDSASRYSGNSLFVNVPPAQAVVITSSLDDGATVVSRRTVLVAGSCFTDVTLYPLTRQQAGRL